MTTTGAADMAGFALDGVPGRIPCPHCGSTDCAGLKWHDGEPVMICCVTQNEVTEQMLRDPAATLGAPTRVIPTRNLQVAVTFKSDPFETGAEVAARLLRQIADELLAMPDYPKWRTVFLDGEDVGRYKLHDPEETP